MKINGIALAALLSVGSALELDVTDEASIKSAASKIAKSLVKGFSFDDAFLLPDPYYWWETGLLVNTLLDYTHLTNDTSVVNRAQLSAVLSHQTGDANNFMPANASKSEGNDDQSYWAFAAMTALEQDTGNATWLPVVENVWNNQAARWDNASCGGGLRWQIFTFNKGYDYKNAASNMNFFLLSARMAAYTGNSTYSDWAGKVWKWSLDSGLVGSNMEVYDGADATPTCTIDKLQFSAQAATAAYGVAIYESLNSTTFFSSPLLTNFVKVFANSSILIESACETQGTCTNDMKAFKGITARYLAKTAQLDTVHADEVNKILEASAKSAAASCQDDGTCGFVWTNSAFDSDTGIGQQLNALSALTALLAKNEKAATVNGTQSEGTATGSASSSNATGTGAGGASATTTSPAAASLTGAASSFGAVSAGWGIGLVALGFVALL